MRLAIAEDNVLLREGLAKLLRDAGLDVVAEVGTADDLMRAVAAGGVDVVVTDIRMPPSHTTEGLRAAETIKRDHPKVGVLVLSQFVQSRDAVKLLDASVGGIGYLLKDRVSNVADLVDAIRRVGDGESVIDSEVVAALMERQHDEALDRLSPRERELLALMAQGMSNSAISKTFFLSPKTVETHISSILSKLDLPPTDDGNRRVLAVLQFLRS